MKWKATHILKVNGDAPRRVMLNSGGYFTKREWDNSDAASWDAAEDGVATRADPHNALFGHRTASVTSLAEVRQGSSVTPLRSEVTRMCTSFTVRRAGKVRRVAVTLAPGDVLIMREEGTRKTSARLLPFSEAWARAGQLQAQRLKAERKAKRKARK